MDSSFDGSIDVVDSKKKVEKYDRKNSSVEIKNFGNPIMVYY